MSTGPETFKRGSTMPYAAPEFLNEKLKVDEKSDAWSFGMLLYELFEGRPPIHYLKLLNAEVLKNLPKFTPILYKKQGGSGALLIDQKIRELAGKLLNYDPKKRPNLSKVEKALFRLTEYLDELTATDSFTNNTPTPLQQI